MLPALPVPVYILASARDVAHREELEKQLAVHRDLISYWSSSQMLLGDTLAPQIEQQLRASRIVLWLISPDFRFAEEQGPEARIALDLERSGALRIVPVLVRITTHYAAPYAGRPVFPDNKVPVSSWSDRDAAWRNVVAGIRRAAQEIAGLAPVYSAPLVASVRPSVPSGAAALRSSEPQPASARPARRAAHTSAPPVPPRSAAFLPPGLDLSEEGSRSGARAGTPLQASVGAGSPARRRVAAVLIVALLVLAGVLSWSGALENVASHSEPPSPVQGELPVTSSSPAVSSPPPSAPAGVCCGGVDCPKEQQQVEGTSCAKGEMCRVCKSGRRRIPGACAEWIPSTDVYKLRLAGATLQGYVPGATDTICVKRPGAPVECDMVSTAMKKGLPGALRISDLTTGSGLDVWFERGGARMRTLRGMRIDHGRSHLMNSAMCIGAVLYSPDRSDILRFFLEDP